MTVNIGNDLLPGNFPPIELLVPGGGNAGRQIYLIGALMPERFLGCMIIKFPVCRRRPDDDGLIEKFAGKSPPGAFSADRLSQRPLLLDRPQLAPRFPGSHTLKGRFFSAARTMAREGIP